jgi:two-component system sensor histidine kinase MprB
VTGSEPTRDKINRLVKGYAATLDEKASFLDGYRLPAYTYDKLSCGLIDAHEFARDPMAMAAHEKLTRGAMAYLPEKALSRAEQQRLVQDAGHELRTPLTSLKTNLSVMRRHPDMSPAMQQQILDDLDGEVAELTELVNELVAVASGELVDQPNERLDLVEMATDVAQRVGRRRSREVVVRGAPTLMIDAPRAGLDRAIANIIDNACKFDQTGQPIQVDVAAHDGLATLTVSDHGPGIPEGDIGKVFDRFHRADAARTMPGSGLGLSIVREVVEGIGGSVQAANRDGGGTVIGFTVPDAPRLLPPPSGAPNG